MAFSFGGLDIRHRLPDAKRSRELLKAPGGAHLSIGVSTPRNGACPFQFHHPTCACGWQWRRNASPYLSLYIGANTLWRQEYLLTWL